MNRTKNNIRPYIYILSIALTIFQVTLSAQTNTQTENQAAHKKPTRFALFAGIAGGYMNSSAPDLGFSTNLDGFVTHGLLGGSIYTSQATIDLGVGFLMSNISGDRNPTSTRPQVISAEVQTRSGFFHISPRYRFGEERFEIGPYADVLFGGSDPFAKGFATKTDAFPVLLGLKGLYNIPLDAMALRIGAQLGTDLTLSQRQLFYVMGVLELSLPLNTEPSSQPQNVQPVTPPPTVEKVVVKEFFNFAFEDEIIEFDFDTANLTERSKQFILTIGRFLVDQADKWETLRIEGHTDLRGAEEYNLDLSRRRAETVKNYLAEAGVPHDRMDAKGFGKSHPIDFNDTEAAHQLNRRVEISFAGVMNPKLFRYELNKIKMQNKAGVR